MAIFAHHLIKHYYHINKTIAGISCCCDNPSGHNKFIVISLTQNTFKFSVKTHKLSLSLQKTEIHISLKEQAEIVLQALLWLELLHYCLLHG